MILSHEDGLEKHYRLRKIFQIELELNCLNSEFLKITYLLKNAKQLTENYPDNVVLKESEMHTEETPYYEVSVFCNKKDECLFTKVVESLNLEIDIIHNWDE